METIDRSGNAPSHFSKLAKAWCQFELGDLVLAKDLVEQSLTVDANPQPHECKWLKNQLANRAQEPNRSILQIFEPAIQMMTSEP